MEIKIGLISSFVVEGYVGLRAAVPAVQMLGGYPLVVPTVIYTTHAGVEGAKGAPIDKNMLRFSLDHLFDQQLDCVVTGFLGEVDCAEIIVQKVQDKKGIMVVDPIIGDYPKGLYVQPDLARLIKNQLIPLSDGITPNRFEAEYLTGRKINSDRCAMEAAGLLHEIGPTLVAITGYKINEEKQRIYDLVSYQGRMYQVDCPLVIEKSSSGAGDMYSGILATLWTKGIKPELSAGVSSALVNRAVFLAYQWGGGTVNPIDTLTYYSPYLQGSEERMFQFLEQVDVILTPLN